MKDSRVGSKNTPDVRGGETAAKRQLGVSIQRCKHDLWVMWEHLCVAQPTQGTREPRTAKQTETLWKSKKGQGRCI